jgi:7-cyano-7-deazaguanine reductase
LWNAYEAGYRLPSGSPRVFSLQFAYPSDSPNMVESKSVKLFLQHLTHETYASLEGYLRDVRNALSIIVQHEVQVALFDANKPLETIHPNGLHLEQTPDGPDPMRPQPSINQLRPWPDCGSSMSYFTHAFQSRCPITGQPDFASVVIGIKEAQVAPSPRSLLAYLLSFRELGEFHEGCCERMFCDLLHFSKARQLRISCHFLRRGGIDINVIRSLGRCEIEWGQRYFRQ